MADSTSISINRALISVSDKTNLEPFAKFLSDQGVKLFSTGGTRKFLEQAGLEVVDIATYTDFPEMMDGRVKTLHPKVFGGILGRRDNAQDVDSMEEHGIVPFDLVCVNLYPFEATVAKPDVTFDEAIEKIDIGGPSLVRAAAKNHRFVAIATQPDQYAAIQEAIVSQGGVSLELRRQLMVAAFQHTAHYDTVISNHFAEPQLTQPADTDNAQANEKTQAPKSIDFRLRISKSLRYGENPHQEAGLYVGTSDSLDGSLVGATQLNGKELSYNNYLDLDAAWAICRNLEDNAVVVIKHNNPCGAASASSIKEAMRLAMEGDPLSAFGSVLAANAPIDQETAEYLATPGLFVEAIVAPSFTNEAIDILTTRPKWKANVRLMAIGDCAPARTAWQVRCIDGGALVQQADSVETVSEEWNLVTKTSADQKLLAELRFGWEVCRHVKSNAITISRDRTLGGVGAGQMSRVDSVEIAIRKAGERAKGGVLASDAFFPFPDSIEQAAQAGIAAIVQPGGSRKDQDVIDACDAHGLPMLFTGRRHFKH